MNKKRILFSVFGAVMLLIGLGAVLYTQTIGKRTTVGFYGIDPQYQDAFRNLTADSEAFSDIRWIELSDEEAFSPKIRRNVDLLVSWNGYLTDKLALNALSLPGEIRARYPRSIQISPNFSFIPDGRQREEDEGREFRVMPVLLNHYEAAYFEVFLRRTGLSRPRTLGDLEGFARASREWAESPMIAAGADDQNLFLMISLLAESVGGAEGYLQLIDDLRNQNDFDHSLEIPIKGKAPEGTTFGSILDLIKGWQREGLLLPEWYEADERLVTVFMEDNHAAAVFMSLEEHRRKPFLTIKYFQAAPFPPQKGVKEATVEPAVSVLCFEETDLTGPLLDLFSSEKGQEQLSAATRLGPSALKGAAFDIQADDARYYAAASSGGPVPDLGRAVFLREKERAEMAGQIREYLSRP